MEHLGTIAAVFLTALLVTGLRVILGSKDHSS